MVIAIDIDDVCNNLIDVVCEELYLRYGYKYKIDDFTEWDFKNLFPEEVINAIFEILDCQSFYDKLHIQNNADKYVNMLRDQGHKIYFVTATYPLNLGKKFKWLVDHFDIQPHEFIAMYDKWLFNADIIVDDKLETLRKCCLMNRICMNKPWNEKSFEWDDAMNIYRVSDWEGVYEAIQDIIKKEEVDLY